MSLLRTPLYDWHVAHGGRMVEFGGWEMPVQYTSIVDEHRAVRTAAGLFDISHMGRLWVTGPEAVEFVNHVVTADASKIAAGQIRYALVTNESGGVLDDVLVYRLKESILLVVNASNREKILAWLKQHQGSYNAHVADLTFSHAMVAVQGPNAISALGDEDQRRFQQLKYYTADIKPLADVKLDILSRTGYTGEDGWEMIVPAERVEQWIKNLEQRSAVVPCGLGARDTLRLESGMPLYGHELTEAIDPFTAGLDFAVKLSKPDFIGKAALEKIAQRPDRQQRIGLQLDGKRIAREGATVLQNDQPVGTVTSGTFSPTLEKSIAMAIVQPAAATIGTKLKIDIRGKRESATVVPLPFYRRPKSS